MERLDKIVSNFGGLTRGEAKEYIKRGRVERSNDHDQP